MMKLNFKLRKFNSLIAIGLTGITLSITALAINPNFPAYVAPNNIGQTSNPHESMGTFPARINPDAKLPPEQRVEVLVFLRAASDRPIGQTKEVKVQAHNQIEGQESEQKRANIVEEIGYQWDWTGGTFDKNVDKMGDIQATYEREVIEELGREAADILKVSDTNVPVQALFNPFEVKWVWLKRPIVSYQDGEKLLELVRNKGRTNVEEFVGQGKLRDPGKETKLDKKGDKLDKKVGDSFMVDAAWVPVKVLFELQDRIQRGNENPESAALAVKIQSKATWLKHHTQGQQQDYKGEQKFGFRKFIGLLFQGPGVNLGLEYLCYLLKKPAFESDKLLAPISVQFANSVENGHPILQGLMDIVPAIPVETLKEPGATFQFKAPEVKVVEAK